MTLGSFFGSSSANAATGTAIIAAVMRIAIRQLRAPGNLKAMPKSRRTKSRCKAARRQRPVKRGYLRAKKPGSALAGLEAALHLVDHVNPALAADQTVVAVAAAQRFQRVTDLHGTILMLRKAVLKPEP